MRAAVLMPLRDEPESPARFALEHYGDGIELDIIHTRGLPLEAARNRLWELGAALDPQPDVVIWADADAFWLRGTLAAAAARVTELGERTIVGSFHGKRRPFSPLQAYQLRDGRVHTITIAEARSAPGGLIPAFFVGSHFFAHSPALFSLLGPAPFALGEGYIGEDHAFCVRALKAGCRILVDANLPVFHCEGSIGFLPGFPPFEYRDGAMHPAETTTAATAGPAQRDYGSAIDAIRRRFAQ